MQCSALPLSTHQNPTWLEASKKQPRVVTTEERLVSDQEKKRVIKV
jgi:hypothetical protein